MYKGAPPRKGPLAQQRLRVLATQTTTLEPGAPLGVTPPKGGRDHPRREPRDHGPGLLVKLTCGAAISTKGEKTRTRQKNTQKRLCRLASEKRHQRRRASSSATMFRKNPGNAQGQKTHPEKTQEKGRTAKPGGSNKAAQQQKETRTNQKTCARGSVWCPVRPDMFLFKKTQPETPRTKKQVLEQFLDVGVGDEVRVAEHVCGHEEETLGETQTAEGFAFPQRLKERKKKQQQRRRKSQTERKRGTQTSKQTRVGSLRAQDSIHDATLETKTKPNKQTLTKPKGTHTHTKDEHKPNKVSGDELSARWRGQWAALHSWGDTPGDRSTEGSEDPPTTGTARRNATTYTSKANIEQ